MSHNLEHQKIHTRMVKEVLKAVARANNHSYQSVFTDFIAGHPSCTVCFRENFHKMYPDSPHEYVTFCHTCRRFDLYETEADRLMPNNVVRPPVLYCLGINPVAAEKSRLLAYCFPSPVTVE